MMRAIHAPLLLATMVSSAIVLSAIEGESRAGPLAQPDEPMPTEPDEPMPESPSEPASAPAAVPAPEAAPISTAKKISRPASVGPGVPIEPVAGEAETMTGPATPGMLLSFRTWSAVPLGAPPSAATAQRFDVVGAELYPWSHVLRIGLVSALGLGGSDAAGGREDFFLEQSASIGVQWPRRVTPYVEGSAGIGFLRRQLFNQDVLTLLYSVGVDAGVALRVYGKATLAVSMGWVRPVYYAAVGTRHVGIYTDSFTFRMAIGF